MQNKFGLSENDSNECYNDSSKSLSTYEDCNGDGNSEKAEKREMRMIRLQDETEYVEDLENGRFV